MNDVYVDSSALVAVAFGASPAGVLSCLSSSRIFAGSLVEAELAAVFRRERRAAAEVRAMAATWTLVVPSESLLPELDRVLDAGYLRGADAWHLACALWLSPNPKHLGFVTLDTAQAAVARAIGFPVVDS